ncbi:MAG: hypothetical protein AAF708_01430 [Deinococcota bacterium]
MKDYLLRLWADVEGNHGSGRPKQTKKSVHLKQFSARRFYAGHLYTGHLYTMHLSAGRLYAGHHLHQPERSYHDKLPAKRQQQYTQQHSYVQQFKSARKASYMHHLPSLTRFLTLMGAAPLEQHHWLEPPYYNLDDLRHVRPRRYAYAPADTHADIRTNIRTNIQPDAHTDTQPDTQDDARTNTHADIHANTHADTQPDAFTAPLPNAANLAGQDAFDLEQYHANFDNPSLEDAHSDALNLHHANSTDANLADADSDTLNLHDATPNTLEPTSQPYNTVTSNIDAPHADTPNTNAFNADASSTDVSNVDDPDDPDDLDLG